MNELAIQLIRKEKEERTGKLDLGDVKLTYFPEELFELEWLNELNLWVYFDATLEKWNEYSNQKVSNRKHQLALPQSFARFQQLKKFTFKGRSFGSRISLDCSILGSLDSLIRLDISGNPIKEISFSEKMTNLTSLNLSHNEIKDCGFLDKMDALISLDLSYNQINDCSFLEKLPALTSINLSHNQIRNFAISDKVINLTRIDLGYNLIYNIHLEEKLVNLTHLDLFGNQISDIRFLENLTSLTSLDLSDNQIKNCRFLKKLTALTRLDMRRNQISNIRSLENLKILAHLDLSDNQISDIRSLENLTHLIHLDLRENKINNIQALIPLIQKGLPVNLEEYWDEGISLYKNPVKEPPLEIIKQGREAILDWFEAKKKKLNEIKIIFLGDPKAGKTSLLKRLKFDTFNEDEPQTDGVNIEDIEFGECEMFKQQQKLHKITGHFWDFGGQEIMNATHQFFLTKRSVYVLVLDARKDANNSSQVRQWVKRIKATGGDSPIIVLANQTDVNPGFGFENERELQNEFPQIKCFLKVSCKNDVNIDLFKNKLEEIIPMAEFFNTQIDERWITIKEILEKETRKDYFLNESRFVSVCNKAGLTEKQKQKNAITFLHDLGLVLHFDDLNLAEYYVLNPYWITYGVYQILTSSYAGEMKGKVVMDQLNFIVNEEEDKKEAYNPASYRKIEYTCNERRFLVDILNQFKLCFCMTDHSQFIIPDLLDTKEPSEVTEPIRVSKECIQFMYDYEYLPKFVMPNIMVEMNQMITDMWRTGCVLQYDGCRALINNYQNRISIVVVGDHKKKREFMSVIRFVINSINEKLSDKPVALIPLPGIKDFADYERLIARERKGKKDYIHDEDKPTEKKFLISELLEGISDSDETRQIAEEILSVVRNTQHNIEKIEQKLDIHYKYLVNLPDNEKIKSSIHEAIQELNVQQTEKICKEIMEWVTTVFVQFDGVMDEKLKNIYNDLKETDDIQAKLKLSIPFINMLGINFETELNVKSWAKKMYQKYKSKVFNLLY